MPPMHKPARNGHLVGDTGQGALGGWLVDAADFEHDRAGADDGHPVFGFALSLTHARLERLTGDGLVRKDANMDAAFATQKVAARDAAGLDLPGRDPRTLERLQAVFAKRDSIAAGGVAFHLASLAFAVANPL